MAQELSRYATWQKEIN